MTISQRERERERERQRQSETETERQRVSSPRQRWVKRNLWFVGVSPNGCLVLTSEVTMMGKLEV